MLWADDSEGEGESAGEGDDGDGHRVGRAVPSLAKFLSRAVEENGVFEAAFEHGVALGAGCPGLGECEQGFVLDEDVRGVLAQDVVELVAEGDPFGRVLHDGYLFEQTVELGVVVSARIFAGGGSVLAVVEEEKVLRIRIIGSPPATGGDLEAPLIELFHHPCEGVLVDLHFDPKFLELALLELCPRPFVGAVGRGLDGDLELLSGGVTAIGVPCLGDQLFRAFEVVAVGVFEVLLVSWNPRGQELLRWHGDVVEEDADVGFFVEG